MEPVGTTSREWATAVCREAGFEPDVRYTSTDLQVHLRLVGEGLAAALLPELADLGRHEGVRSTPLAGDPVRRVFAATRSGARRRPALQAVVGALRAVAPRASAPRAGAPDSTGPGWATGSGRGTIGG